MLASIHSRTIDNETLDHIRFVVRNHIRQHNLPLSEYEDLVQEVSVHLLSQSGQFNESVAGWSTYVNLVVRRRLISIHRQSTTRKETLARTATSLHRSTSVGDGGVSELCNEIQTAASPLRNMLDSRSVVSCFNLRNDFREVVGRLPDELSELCHQLTIDLNYSRICQELSISRATLYRRLAVLKRTLSEFGLGDYLCDRS